MCTATFQVQISPDFNYRADQSIEHLPSLGIYNHDDTNTGSVHYFGVASSAYLAFSNKANTYIPYEHAPEVAIYTYI